MDMNRFKKRRKINLFRMYSLLIVFLFIIMGIGFSLGETSITIEGESQFNNNIWDIAFDNLEVNSGSISASTPAEISESDPLKINFGFSIGKTNTYYEFEVDVVNRGGLDAELSKYSITGVTSELSNFIDCVFTYSDGSPLTKGDLLLVGESKRIKVRVSYKADESTYIYNDMASTVNFNVSYIQK